MMRLGEAARVLAVSKRSIYRMIRRGVLVPIRVVCAGTRVRWSDVARIGGLE